MAEIDDLDAKAKMLEKFYELTDKLSIKVITIEEVLKKDAKSAHEGPRLGEIELYEKKHTVNDKQYKDFIKLYFNDISKIKLLTGDEEKEIARRIKR